MTKRDPIADPWPPDPAQPAEQRPACPASPERYRPLAEVGRGGMGSVERLFDASLERQVVRKVLHEALWPADAGRFLAEAKVTAQLQHPGVIPVHDVGALDDGRPFYVMEEVRGRTLGAVIDELHQAERPALPLRRALDVMRRVCETVAYAHSRGVIHRDLKPDNIMLGAFGEVRVLDWGLAGEHQGSADAAEAPISASSGATQAGEIVGTPAYMPPEQAQGERAEIGPWSDVYALGATLYHLLAGVPPYTGRLWAVLAKLLTGPPEPLAWVAAQQGQHPPAELVALVERAMHRDRARRPTAAELGAALADWLDGAQRQDQALALVSQADALLPGIDAARAEAARVRAEAEAQLATLPPFAPEEQRHPAWALLAQAAALEQAALQDELRQTRLLSSALETFPGLPEADARLATLYRREHEAAEARRDGPAAARFEALLRAHDRGAHAAWLSGDGALSLVTDPPGAEAILYQYEEQHRRLVPTLLRSLGPTPLRDVPLPRGSYLVLLRHPGRVEVRYPVFIGRGERWQGRAPGEDAPRPIALPPALGPEALGPEDCYVPAGWFWSGGDPGAAEGLPRARRWVHGFVVRRFPVRNREYLDFLNDLVARGEGAAAAALNPSASSFESGEQETVFAADRDGRFALRDPPLAYAGGLDWPVTRIRWWDALAFAAWEAARTGRPWRLMPDQAWEKAARGVDGRSFPWGDDFDPSRARMVASRPGALTSGPVEDFPLDESPYGVRGCCGNVRDWCANDFSLEGPEGPLVSWQTAPPDAPYRMVRGGAWASDERFCRLASRFADPPDRRVGAIGLRLGFLWPAQRSG